MFRLPVAGKTIDYSIVESDTNRCLTNALASGAVKFTLPSAVSSVIGVHLHFSVETAQSFVIAPASADTIRIGGTASATGANGGKITASGVGDTIHLVCTQLTKWVSLGHEGSWTITT